MFKFPPPPEGCHVQPGDATTAAEFVELMNLLKVSVGRSLSELSRWGDVPASTLADALSRPRLPHRRVLHGFLLGCGLNAEERQEWTTTWVTLSVQEHRRKLRQHSRTAEQLENLAVGSVT
jgi:ubiquinone biosynthesis protein UbiJ